MKCKICQEVNSEEFLKDFKKGVCLPCQVQYDYDLNEIQLIVELKQYYQRTGFMLDQHEFYAFCETDKVKLSDIDDLPKLRDIYRCAKETIEFMKSEYNKPRQLSLFNQEDDLPF